jgi:Fe-S cluster assembly protein SufD
MAAGAALVETYRTAFEALERTGPAPDWLRRLRREAMARFAETGFPTVRQEEWRHTSVAPLVEAALPPAPAVDRPGAGVGAGALDGLLLLSPGWRLVFVDGRHVAALSSPSAAAGGGLRVRSLAEALSADDPVLEAHLGRHAGAAGDGLTALSTAFAHDGACVYLPPGTRVAEPIHLLFLGATRALLQPRSLVIAGRGSEATIIEHYGALGDEAYWTNAVTEIVVEEDATVHHVKLQEEGAAAFHVSTLQVDQGRDSTFRACSAALGARLARNNLGVRLGAEGGSCQLDGLYMMAHRQHVDNHVTVDHARPRCTSRQLYKGILDGRSRAVFNGRVIVRRDAQKTDAAQTNRTLLLAEGPEVYSQPQLEIFADDVRCTHGAAEGQLAEEAIFYLKSRGLGDRRARTLLTQGFASEVIGRITVEPVRERLERLVRARLRAGEAQEEAA